jgi:hypothetical protein
VVSHKRAPTGLYTGQRCRGDENTLCFLEVGFCCVHEPQVRFDVHVETPIPVVLVYVIVQVGNVSQACPAAVGEDNVESAHAGYRLVDHVDDVIFLGEVTLDAVKVEGLAELGGRDGLELVKKLESTVGVRVVVDNDADARLGKQPSRIGTETGGPGCDEGSSLLTLLAPGRTQAQRQVKEIWLCRVKSQQRLQRNGEGRWPARFSPAACRK